MQWVNSVVFSFFWNIIDQTGSIRKNCLHSLRLSFLLTLDWSKLIIAMKMNKLQQTFHGKNWKMPFVL